MAPSKTLYLIDGNAYVHRAYHALPVLTTSRGEPVQALYGFARMLLKILRQEKPDYLAVCFDTAAPTFRHKAFAQYKAHRKEIDDALKFQLPLSKDLAEAWGLPVVAKEGFEADDVIATLASRGEKQGLRVVVVTSDKDALQLVNENVRVLNEPKNLLMDTGEVEKKYGLPPDRLVDFFALTGDASDNVPGVPGVGETTAVQILKEFGTLDGAYKRLAEMKEAWRKKLAPHKEQAVLSRDLVVLDRDVPLDLAPTDCTVRTPDLPRLTELLKRFEFSSLLQELLPQNAAAGEGGKTSRRQVEAVTTEEGLKALLRELSSAEELAVDVETTGTDPLRCDLVGIALSKEEGRAWYIPVGHSYAGCPPQLPLKKVLSALAPFLEGEKPPKVGQNLKFDLLVLRRHGLRLGGVSFDTLIASYCLNPSRLAHGLKALAADMLGESMTNIEELIGKGAKQIAMDRVPVESAAPYAGADAEVSLRLKSRMEPLLKEKKLEALFRDVEMPLVPILADMEEAGVGVDAAYLRKLEKEFKEEIEGLEKAIYGLAGETLNLNSPKQLSALLFEKLKLPVVRRTKTGASTDEEVLKKLSALHPLPAKLVEYRELSKLHSTYIAGLLERINPDTGRIHSSFNQAVAATGRLSSSDPNLQNIPIRTEHGRRIRKAFVPAKGCVFLSADYSQIDLRMLAHVSGDKALCEAFRKGEDIHAATAREIFGLKKGEPVSEDRRRVAKTVNFGIVYGQTAYGLSQQIGLELSEAKDYIDRYFLRYQGVHQWIAGVLEQARKDGYVTTILNRIRYLPEINAANAGVRAFAERTAMNTPIQGASADIIKVAMKDVVRLLADKKFNTRLLLQVHDELLFDVPEKELAEAAPLIREKMEGALRLDVPIVVDLKKGVNWSEMEKMRDK